MADTDDTGGLTIAARELLRGSEHQRDVSDRERSTRADGHWSTDGDAPGRSLLERQPRHLAALVRLGWRRLRARRDVP